MIKYIIGNKLLTNDNNYDIIYIQKWRNKMTIKQIKEKIERLFNNYAKAIDMKAIEKEFKMIKHYNVNDNSDYRIYTKYEIEKEPIDKQITL